MDQEDSNDSDIFIEFQLKPVNKLTRKTGLHIKNKVLKQTQLCFSRGTMQLALKPDNENELSPSRRKRKSSTPIKSSPSKVVKECVTPTKNSTKKSSPKTKKLNSEEKTVSIQQAKITVRNDLLLSGTASVQNQSVFVSNTSTTLCITNRKASPPTSPSTPSKSSQTQSADHKTITLSPSIRNKKKRFKSLSNILENVPDKTQDAPKKKLFQEAAFESPKKKDPTLESLDADILGLIMEDVLRTQLQLKDNHLIKKGYELESLLSEQETTVIEKYLCADRRSQTLFMRMLFRKNCWHRVESIKYEDLGPDLEDDLNYLESIKLIQRNIEKESLSTTLDMLKVPELMKMYKMFNIAVMNNQKSNRKDVLAAALIKQIQTQKSVADMYRAAKGQNRLEMVKEAVRNMLGPCFRIEPSVRTAVERIILLFSLPHDVDDESKRLASQRLLILQVLAGSISFVPYTVSPTVIFETRSDFLEYESAMVQRVNLETCLMDKQLEAFNSIGQLARESFIRLQNDRGFCERYSRLPSYLKRYNAGSVYASILTSFCENFKKKQDDEIMCQILVMLLKQNLFGKSRGKWYGLLCQQYQKAHNLMAAAELIIQASKDSYVEEKEMVALKIKAATILRAKKNALEKGSVREELKALADDMLPEPTSVEINAQAVVGNVQGSKLVYKQETPTGTYYSSVEEEVLSYYKNQGDWKGCHVEGYIVSTIFYILFFDIIYESKGPGVFQSPYQNRPLDLWSKSFFSNRQDALTMRLNEMTSWTSSEVASRVENVFAAHLNTTCVINWRSGLSPEWICEIIECLGLWKLKAICERFAREPRQARSGFPDLTLYNPVTKKCKFVEVKSPNDRLAPNQRVWMEYLRRVGIDCEVCNVRNGRASSAMK